MTSTTADPAVEKLARMACAPLPSCLELLLAMYRCALSWARGRELAAIEWPDNAEAHRRVAAVWRDNAAFALEVHDFVAFQMELPREQSIWAEQLDETDMDDAGIISASPVGKHLIEALERGKMA